MVWLHYSKLVEIDHVTTSDNIDFATLGVTSSVGGMFYIAYKSWTKRVSGGGSDNYFDESVADVVPSGYTAIGLVGMGASGEGYTRWRINNYHLYYSGTTPRMIVAFYNDYPHTINNGVIACYVLCIKSSN